MSTSSSSSPEDQGRERARSGLQGLQPTPSREGGQLSLSSLRQLRQELEDAKAERRSLLKQAQNAIKNPLKVVQVPHRLDNAASRKSEATNQRRKALKEVVDALTVSLRGKGQANQAKQTEEIFDYDIEIQAVVSFVQDKFRELLGEHTDDLKAKSRAHRHKALAKCEADGNQRLRNAERAARQEQQNLSEELVRAKRREESLRKRLNAQQLEGGKRDREHRAASGEWDLKERRLEERAARAEARAARAEKRCTEQEDLASARAEEAEKRAQARIREHEGRSEASSAMAAKERERADHFDRKYRDLLRESARAQENLAAEVSSLEAAQRSQRDDLLALNEACVRSVGREAEEWARGAVGVLRGCVADMVESCAASEAARLRAASRIARRREEEADGWIRRQAHESAVEELRTESEARRLRVVDLESQVASLRKAQAKAQSDKAVADTKVRRIAETAAELRRRAEESEGRQAGLRERLAEEMGARKRAEAESASEGERRQREVGEAREERDRAVDEAKATKAAAWEAASSSLSEMEDRVSLLAQGEPVKLSPESWAEVLAAIERRGAVEGQSEGESGESGEGGFLRALNGLETKFTRALRKICAAAAPREEPQPPASPARKPRPREILRTARAAKPKPSPKKAQRSRTQTDVQTAISCIRRARELSCFDARMAAARREGTGIKSLAKGGSPPLLSS